MTESRSSSAVRNLRSIFENKTSDNNTSDSRGRSPNGLGSDKENNYQQPKSKVRASFVAVAPVPGMAASVENAGGRRGSFGEADVDLDLRQTISDQQNDMTVPEGAVESMPPSVVATPLRPPNEGRLGYNDPVAVKMDNAPENPDKPVTGAAEEPGDMKPADPATENAVSGGEALPSVTEDLRSSSRPTPSSIKAANKSEAKKTPTSSKPAAISTQSSSKPSSASIKSPASQPKTPVSANVSSSIESPAAKRPPRSSLTAPTAASMARSGAVAEKPKTSPDSKPKPREVTKPINISSHLTAPTAASKAKHEPEAAPISSTFRTSLATRPKPHIPSTKPPARSSLAAGHRPQSQDSQTSGRRSLAAVDGSFLDRMTRPTAASSGRTHEKVIVQSPPKSKASKPKVNGQLGNHAAKSNSTDAPVDETELEHESLDTGSQPGLTLAANATTIDNAMAAVEDQNSGNETPNHHPLDQADGALEATPAGLGGEDTIR